MNLESETISEVNLKQYTSKFIIWIWPILLFVSWILLFSLSYSNDVFFKIPENLRTEITGNVPVDVPGFMQDPFFHIFQFFWIPFIWLSLRSFNLLSETLNFLWKNKLLNHKEALNESKLKKLLEESIISFNKSINRKRLIFLCLCIGIVSMLYQVHIQYQRMLVMDIMYWWDWRISHTIYIVRLLMIGIDMMLGSLIVIMGLNIMSYFRKFSTEFEFSIKPFYHDNAGGLSSIGKLCISFVYPMLVIVLMIVFSFIFHEEMSYWIVNFGTCLLYIPLLFFTFFFPLKIVHKKMKEYRAIKLDKFSRKINSLLEDIAESKDLGQNSKAAEIQSGFIKNLRYCYETMEKTPVWPYDLRTITKFYISIILPVAMMVVGKFINHYLY